MYKMTKIYSDININVIVAFIMALSFVGYGRGVTVSLARGTTAKAAPHARLSITPFYRNQIN